MGWREVKMNREGVHWWFCMVGMVVGLAPVMAVAQELFLVSIDNVGVYASPQEAVTDGAVPIAELAPGQFAVLRHAAECPDADGGFEGVCGRLLVRGVEVYTVVVDTAEGCRAGFIQQSDRLSMVATVAVGYSAGAPAGCLMDRVVARSAPSVAAQPPANPPASVVGGWNEERMLWVGMTQCMSQPVGLQLQLWGTPGSARGLLTVTSVRAFPDIEVPVLVQYEPQSREVLLTPAQVTGTGPVSNWSTVGVFGDDLRVLNATLITEEACAPFALSRTE